MITGENNDTLVVATLRFEKFAKLFHLRVHPRHGVPVAVHHTLHFLLRRIHGKLSILIVVLEWRIKFLVPVIVVMR